MSFGVMSTVKGAVGIQGEARRRTCAPVWAHGSSRRSSVFDKGILDADFSLSRGVFEVLAHAPGGSPGGSRRWKTGTQESGLGRGFGDPSAWGRRESWCLEEAWVEEKTGRGQRGTPLFPRWLCA